MSAVTSGSDSVVVGIVHVTHHDCTAQHTWSHLTQFVCNSFSSHNVTITSGFQELCLPTTRFPCARVRKYHRLRHKQSLLSQISPLARFHKRFFRMIEWSWKELLCTHLYDDDGGVGGVTVIKDEMNAELQWASSRKLSMFNAFSQPAGFSGDSLKALIDHYGIDRVSSAKEKGGKESLLVGTDSKFHLVLCDKVSERFSIQGILRKVRKVKSQE